jgi:acyl-CoA reductase-like NAD-dependent aldehyde dehydrogenase
MARQIGERKEEMARLIVTEVGKTITDSRGEVGRCVHPLFKLNARFLC